MNSAENARIVLAAFLEYNGVYTDFERVNCFEEYK